jgi:hypothetical protein
MPSISVRGQTKQKFQAKCKQLGTSMKAKIEELISEFIEQTPSVREQGIKAIISLQGMMGVQETKEDAAAGWDAMTVREQNDTLSAYLALNGQTPKTDALIFRCEDEKGAERMVNLLSIPGYQLVNAKKDGSTTVITYRRV